MASDSRMKIELAAVELLARHGFHGFSLKALSKAANLPYGSIYHLFPGKEEIAVAAITSTGTMIGRLIAKGGDNPVLLAGAMFDLMAGKLAASDWANGCPIGTPALDGANDAAAVRQACVQAFDAMIGAYAGLLTELGLPEHEAVDLALTVVAAYEGATMLARARHSDAPLRTVSAAMGHLISTALA